MGNQTLLILLSIKKSCAFFLFPFFHCHLIVMTMILTQLGKCIYYNLILAQE